MFYYKQMENDNLISVQSASVHLEYLPDGFEEITEEEYNTIQEELSYKPELTNREKRRQAYSNGEVEDTDYCVTWNEQQYTTDALTLLGMQYAFRGEMETATAIQTIVEAGVAVIREAFPDEYGVEELHDTESE